MNSGAKILFFLKLLCFMVDFFYMIQYINNIKK